MWPETGSTVRVIMCLPPNILDFIPSNKSSSNIFSNSLPTVSIFYNIYCNTAFRTTATFLSVPIVHVPQLQTKYN